MESVYVKKFVRLFLLTAFVFTAAGCGSNSSTASSPESNATGSLAAKLMWSNQAVKETAKTLYVAPAGVANIQIVVSAADMQGTVSGSFPADDNSGTLHGIPAGSGRLVTARGLDSGGNILYQGINTVDIIAGQTAIISISMAPVTTASPRGGTYTSPQSVILTASVPATIYYITSATNGADPTTNSPVYGNTPISISGHVFLKFFAVDSGNNSEAVKTEEYFTP